MSGRKRKVLLIDDSPATRKSLETILRGWGFDVLSVDDGDNHEADVVISDVTLSEISRLQVNLDFRNGGPARSILLIGARDSGRAPEDYSREISPEFPPRFIPDFDPLRQVLEEANHEIDLRRKSRRLAGRAEPGGPFPEFAASSKEMQEVFRTIETVAPRDVPVIITGESGTGKELVANAIHRLSPRSEGPFVAINAAAIPETLIESEIFGHERGAFTGAIGTRPGCFEQAHGGTLFLDEIAEMPLALQPKLLRVLADGRVRRLGGQHEFAFNVRVIAATNRSPELAIKEGHLREDLFYRLSVIPIDLPSLRSRPTDIPLLAQRFISEFNARYQTNVEGLSEEASHLLRKYSWPGNVRELRNVIERAVLLSQSKWIEPAALPADFNGHEPDRQIVFDIGATTLAKAERELIVRTLAATGHNKTETARLLGLDVKTVYNKLKSYGVEA